MIGPFEQFVVKTLLRRPCPDAIPRSGEEGRRVSCYSIYLKTGDGNWLLLIKGIDETGFSGSRWDGTSFKNQDLIPFSAARDASIEIKRYIGFFSFTYLSAFECVLKDWTYFNRLPILWEALSQFFFSRRDLGLTERIETLQALVQASINDPKFGVTEVTLPALLHGHRWILHPDKKRQQNYARLLLASFEESGELKKDNNGIYRTTGKALTSLSLYEVERQRHEQMLSQSRHMKWLTFVLIIVGAVSAFVTYVVSKGQ
jgi:hypothetical protein